MPDEEPKDKSKEPDNKNDAKNAKDGLPAADTEPKLLITVSKHRVQLSESAKTEQELSERNESESREQKDKGGNEKSKPD